MTLKFTDLIQSDYERVLVAHEELSGFNSIVAIHNTRRGPALGGVGIMSMYLMMTN